MITIVYLNNAFSRLISENKNDKLWKQIETNNRKKKCLSRRNQCMSITIDTRRCALILFIL